MTLLELWFSQGICPVVGLLDHMVILFLVFILQFVNTVCHIDCFAYTEESLHSWDKPHLIMVYDPFDVLLDSVCYILLRIFASMFICDIGL